MNDRHIRERLESARNQVEELRGQAEVDVQRTRDQLDSFTDSIREVFEAVHHGTAHSDSGEETVRAEIDGYGGLRHLEISPHAFRDMDCQLLSVHCGHAISAARAQLATQLTERTHHLATGAAGAEPIAAADIGTVFDIAKEVAWRG